MPNSKKKHRQVFGQSNTELSQMFQQGLAIHQQGQLDMAEMIYRTILEIDSNCYPALHMLGVIAAQQRNFPKAIDLISAAITIYPADPATHFNLANALKDMGRLDDALTSYNKAISLNPDYAEAYSNRGIVLKGLGNPGEALASFDKAIKLRSNYADAYYNRGNTLQDLNQLQAAIQSFELAIKFRPNYAEAYTNRGNALKSLNLLDAAAESYQKALDIAPGHQNALAGLGRVLLKKGKHHEGLKLQRAAFGSICFDIKNGLTIIPKVHHATS